MLKKLIAVCAMSLSLAACSGEPSKEQVKESVKRVIPIAFEVLEISKLKEVPGMFEVVLRVNNQPLVFYVDKKVEYILSGSLMTVATKTNLTQETQKKFLPK